MTKTNQGISLKQAKKLIEQASDEKINKLFEELLGMANGEPARS